MRHKNTKYIAISCVLRAPNAPKPVFCRGSAPDPAGKLTTLPQAP